MLGAISYHPIVRVHLGPLSISPHGVGIAVGFLLGARLMLPTAKRKGIGEDAVYTLLTRAAIGAIIGARLAYVFNHFSSYSSPLEALKVWKGGISLLGGIFGAILAALPKMRSERLSFWKVMDAAAPGIALGVIIGRIGDLIVADHLGKPTSFFLGYRCPPPTIATASPCNGVVVHQTALYDFISSIVLLTVLLYLRRRRERYDGFLITVFGAWYGSMRIVEDFLREDVRHFGLTGSQWTSVVTVAVCLYALVFLRRTPRWGRWDRPADLPEGEEVVSPATEPEREPEPVPAREPVSVATVDTFVASSAESVHSWALAPSEPELAPTAELVPTAELAPQPEPELAPVAEVAAPEPELAPVADVAAPEVVAPPEPELAPVATGLEAEAFELDPFLPEAVWPWPERIDDLADLAPAPVPVLDPDPGSKRASAEPEPEPAEPQPESAEPQPESAEPEPAAEPEPERQPQAEPEPAPAPAPPPDEPHRPTLMSLIEPYVED